jgi:hypothetical protein
VLSPPPPPHRPQLTHLPRHLGLHDDKSATLLEWHTCHRLEILCLQSSGVTAETSDDTEKQRADRRVYSGMEYTVFKRVSLCYPFCLARPWYSFIADSSSTSCFELSSIAAPKIWVVHLFLGRSRLLFPVDLYDNMYRGKRLWSIGVRRLNQLSLYLMMVSLRLFTFNVFLIASSVKLSCLVTPKVELKNLISTWIQFLRLYTNLISGFVN